MTATWTQLFPASAPDPRLFPSVAQYEGRDTLLLFGGRDGSGDLDDTWSFDGTTWTQLSPATVPPARRSAALCYDPATDSILMFGGESGVTWLTDTWLWDGTDWTLLTPATSPSGPGLYAICHDAANGNVVMWLPVGPETWLWDGTTWAVQSPAASPSERITQIIYDQTLATVVLWGGSFLGTTFLYDDTWTWDGSNWTQLFPAASPPARRIPVMAYGDTCAGAVMFGGVIGFTGVYGSDTWTFDGTTWTEVTPAVSPPGRWEAGMAAYVDPEALVLFGGDDAGYLGDTWTFTCGPVPPTEASPPYLDAHFSTV